MVSPRILILYDEYHTLSAYKNLKFVCIYDYVMHEFSIALNIVEIVEQEVRKNNAHSVEQIELDIGKLSGIEPSALEFAWEQAVLNTVLAKAERKINYINGRAVCQECGAEFELDQIYDPCPVCNSFLKDILGGRELRVKSLTVS